MRYAWTSSMKKWFKNYLQLDNDIDSNVYRKNVTNKFVFLLIFPILFVSMLGNFTYNYMILGYVNLFLLVVTSILLYVPGRERKYDAHIILHVVALGNLLVVYFHKGQEYTPLWSFLYIFLVMSLYGHKIGLRIAVLFFSILLSMLFSFTGTTVSVMEFFRFSMVSCVTILFAYLAEMLIASTFEKLFKAKTLLEKLTKTDALTGLFNRRFFDEILPLQISIAKRHKTLLALVIIDIDHFKDYNDTFGHPAGDIALVELSKLLKVKIKRANDAVFRIGGEEFSLLYQAKNEEMALKVIEDIRLAVENLHEYCHLEQKITISAGLLIINSEQSIASTEAYEFADKLLYEAKKSGRNKVILST